MLLEKNGSQYTIADLNDESRQETLSKRKLKRVPINNTLRGKIKVYLAGKQLSSESTDVRKSAAQKLLSDLDADALALFKERVELETNPDVIYILKSGISLDKLVTGEPFEKSEAVKFLSESLEPAVRNALTGLAETGSDELKPLAQKALLKIEDKVAFYGFLEKLFFGLSLGSVLVLAAIGLAITFGVMGCINMAHGELIMIGAYTTYVIQLLMPNSIGASLIIAVPAAFIVSGLVGIAIERGIIQFLKGRPLETLLATFGVSLVLQQLVRSIFSPLNRSVETPEWMSGALDINPIFAITYNRLYIIFFCLAVFALLFFVLRKTVLGLQVRAVSQNRNMARAMGVKSEWVDALTFGLGSGVAGVAGVALSQLTNVGPNLGQSYIIDSFMVVVFGGVGNLWGTLVAGMSLGVANKMLEPVSGAVLAKILVLVFIILFIQKKPRGLFPQKGRAAED
jgi:urea transport system permease protein